MTTVPVKCRSCTWTGWRPAKSVSRRTCPNCDTGVVRNRKVEQAAKKAAEWRQALPPPPIEAFTPPSRQLSIIDAIAATKAPVPSLPNPYVMPVVQGRVQIFRIPSHCQRRGATKRRKRSHQ